MRVQSVKNYKPQSLTPSVCLQEAYFYAVHSGPELDLFMIADGRRLGVEFKREDAPRLTSSMKSALLDLKLDHLSVIYPGTRRYALHEKITVMPLNEIRSPARLIAP